MRHFLMTVALLLPPHHAAQDQSTGSITRGGPQAASAPGCALRFDGLYEDPRRINLTRGYIRFWKDGTAGSTRSASSDDAVSSARGDARYRVSGCDFEIDTTFVGSVKTYAGTIGTDSIRITKGGFLWEAGAYNFIPVDVDAAAKRNEEASKARYARRTAELRAALGPVTIQVGSASMGEACDTFVASQAPFVFPRGTTEFAYQVGGGGNAQGSIDTKICSAGTTVTRTCTTNAIIRGEPVPKTTTVVFACQGNTPFVPGDYILSVGGMPFRLTISR